MKRVIIAFILTLSICIGMMVPAFGLSSKIKTTNTIFDLADSVFDIKDTDSEVMYTVPDEQIKSFCQYNTSNGSLATETCDKIASIASDLVGNEEIDFLRLYASAKQRNPESIRRASMNIDRAVRIPSVEAVRGLRSTSFVSNETELAAALADSTVTIIIITASFPLTYTHSINRSLFFMTLGNTYTITAASGEGHFLIQNLNSPISVTFSSVVLDGNSLGGGIVINNSYVTINGANIQHCYDSAISANNNARDPVTNVIQESGSLTINGGSFTYNLIDDGNAISSVGPISIYGATISHNNGNGVLALNLDESGSTAYFESVSIFDNETESGGGGLYLLFYSVVITGQENIKSEISYNTAQQTGGGVFCYMCDTEISYTNIDGNTLTFVEQNGRSPDPTAVGGAGIMNVGSLSLENSDVLDNTGDCDYGFGVGIYALNPAAVLNNYDPDDYPWLSEAFKVTDSTISGNECEWATGADPYDRSMNGGGIAAIGLKPELTRTEISDNEALIGGGTLLFYAYDEDDLGPQDDPVIHFSGITVEDNVGKLAGGGIAMIGPDREDDDDDVVPASIKCKLQLEKNVENNNENPVETLTTISGNTSRYGAGITVFSVEVTVKDGTVVQNNYADSSFTPFVGNDWPNWACAGGGVLLAQQSKLDLSSGAILSNTTLKTSAQQSAGAGVYAMGTTVVLMNGIASKVNSNGTGVSVHNDAVGNTTYGGGIYTEVQSSLSVVSGEIKMNNAGYGAGNSCQGVFSMSGGIIENNTASEDGGGIYLNTTGNLCLSGGSVKGNQAKNGGGIYAAAQMTLSGGTIENNHASVNGGGVYATKAVTMSLTAITGNTATINGGGVLYNSALKTWTMHSGSISENIANGDGGGFYGMGARMQFVMDGGTISYNLAGHENDDEDTDFHRGGGIYLAAGIGVCSIESGAIFGNIAIHGGGIYTKRNMNLIGGSVTENYAYDENGYATANENPPGGKGGGLYIDTSSTVNNYNSVCSITDNEADVLAYANVFCIGQYNT